MAGHSEACRALVEVEAELAYAPGQPMAEALRERSLRRACDQVEELAGVLESLTCLLEDAEQPGRLEFGPLVAWLDGVVA